jgi:hypothetical protein
MKALRASINNIPLALRVHIVTLRSPSIAMGYFLDRVDYNMPQVSGSIRIIQAPN